VVVFFRVANGEEQDIGGLGRFDGGHHVMRAGIVFPIAEDEQRAAALGFTGKFFLHGIIDGVVEGRPFGSFLRGTQLAEFCGLLSMLVGIVFIETIRQFLGGLREIAGQPDVIAKNNQEGAILGTQDFLQENFQIPFMLFDELILATAEIQDQTQRERNVNTFGEERDRLRNGIFKNVDVVLGEVLNQGSIRVARGERHCDQVRSDADGRLRQAKACNQSQDE